MKGGLHRIKGFLKDSSPPDCLSFSPVLEIMRGFFMSVPNRIKSEGDGFFVSSGLDGKPNKADATGSLGNAISGGTPKSQPGCERIAGGVAGVTVS